MNSRTHSKRTPPVHIPLSFDDAVGGLLAVDPKGLPKATAKAQAGGKRAGKKPVKAKAKKR